MIRKQDKIIDELSLTTSKILRRLPLSMKLKKKYNLKRHNWVIEKITPYLEEAYDMVEHQTEPSEYNNDGPIWIFWWQGENDMPLIVKKCFRSVMQNARERNVILVTKNNYKEFTDISSTILDKLNLGQMTLTHFSDIMRFNLLNNHGGLWLDATIFVTGKINKNYFNKLFTCCGYQDPDHFFIANGRWTGFLIGGRKKLRLFKFMNNFFRLYWSENDFLLDYFLIDYALWYAWNKNLDGLQTYTKENNGINNPNLFKLYPLLNDRFDIHKYNSIQHKTIMYKLSYKESLSNKSRTFFDVVINK